MNGREYNTDDRKRQGQHKRQAQIWTDMDETNKNVCIAPAIQQAFKNASFNIKIWMTQNRLKLNDDKTEFLFIASKYFKQRFDISEITIGNSVVSAVSQARNIGVIFDDVMTMSNHISSICKTANYHLRNIRSIRCYLTTQATSRVIHAFVTSRIDANNSLLSGLPATSIRPLQLIQNQAVKLLAGARKYDHISPILRSLYWLPVASRIHYKIILLTFKALHGLAPLYLLDLLAPYDPPKHLRSSNSSLLLRVRTRSRAGDRSFETIAPTLWNSLPYPLRITHSLSYFKSGLKTYLFSEL